MKTFFFFIALTFTSLSFSQGNLQFNQVFIKNYTGTGTSESGNSQITYTTTTLVVPSGKVWKVESSGIQLFMNPVCVGCYVLRFPGTQSVVALLMDNIVLTCITGSTMINYENKLPIWIPEGTYTIKLFGSHPNDYATIRANAYLSIIEFNIVP